MNVADELIQRLQTALEPCKVQMEIFDFEFTVGVAWRHPNGGAHAIRTRNKPENRTALVEMIERQRNYMIATAEWSHVRTPTRWQRWTMWFRPEQRAVLALKAAALEFAAAVDGME